MVLSGTVESFDSAAFLTQLAASLNVPESSITLDITSGSVHIDVAITAPPGQPASSLVDAIDSTTLAAAAGAAGRSVESYEPPVTTVVFVQIQPPPPPAPLTPLNNGTLGQEAVDNGDNQRMVATIVMLGGCAVGAFIFLCVVLLLVCHFTRDTRRTSRRLNRRQRQAAKAGQAGWRAQVGQLQMQDLSKSPGLDGSGSNRSLSDRVISSSGTPILSPTGSFNSPLGTPRSPAAGQTDAFPDLTKRMINSASSSSDASSPVPPIQGMQKAKEITVTGPLSPGGMMNTTFNEAQLKAQAAAAAAPLAAPIDGLNIEKVKSPSNLDSSGETARSTSRAKFRDRSRRGSEQVKSPRGEPGGSTSNRLEPSNGAGILETERSTVSSQGSPPSCFQTTWNSEAGSAFTKTWDPEGMNTKTWDPEAGKAQADQPEPEFFMTPRGEPSKPDEQPPNGGTYV